MGRRSSGATQAFSNPICQATRRSLRELPSTWNSISRPCEVVPFHVPLRSTSGPTSGPVVEGRLVSAVWLGGGTTGGAGEAAGCACTEARSRRGRTPRLMNVSFRRLTMDTAWIILDPSRKRAPAPSPSRSILAGVSTEVRTPLRRWTIAVLALYALVVLCAPALHHDFACHDKTPGHCVA